MHFERHEDKQVKISLSELRLKAWKLTVFSRWHLAGIFTCFLLVDICLSKLEIDLENKLSK